MPAKYREMADFHQYYSGERVAPYLTIFVGGNHEASNHLFELYYGGWVAPNIYYLGAANVLRLGNLRIAGMSGIWKGYDYRKPHFERLPYNQEELTTIYHVRELDVRKLLAIRSQVDIGISHDWPQTVEWSGDWAWLFRKKDRFQADAENGKLGNVAAKYVLDRLRPAHWFSAHLHVRYPATYDHENPTGIRTRNGKPLPRAEHQQQVSAWKGFHEQAKQDDADEQERMAQEQLTRREDNVNGTKPAPGYKFDETFKQVTMYDNLSRTVDIQAPMPTKEGIPQVDGTCYSRPPKRPRESNSPDRGLPVRSPRYQALNTPWPRDVALTESPKKPKPAQLVKNPDEIDLGLSDDEPAATVVPVANNPDQIDLDLSDEDVTMTAPRRSGSPFPVLDDSRKSEQSVDGGMALNGGADEFKPTSRKNSQGSTTPLDPAAPAFAPQNDECASRKSSESNLRVIAADFKPMPKDAAPAAADESIPDDIRAELEGLSKTFNAPAPVEVSPTLPFPEEITNKKTNFLALDKCLPGRHFLELMEIESISSTGQTIQRPVQLEYDPEWLAILRAFADELHLGGDKNDPVITHRGDTFYQDRILEERKWVFEHIVSEEKLQIPHNFEITAPVYDASLQIGPNDMPREVTNPQTVQFCQMLGIDNPFHIDEAARDERMAAGPKAESDWFSNRGRGNRNRGRGGWGGGRGGGRGGRGGRGRGRGGGGGRGRW